MEIKYTKCEKPTNRPCLMENEFSEIFLVTDGIDGQIFVTRLQSDLEGCVTWETELDGYSPLSSGTKIEIIN